MFEDFLHLQPGHLRGLKQHVSKNQQKCPEQIMTWAAKQVAINKVNKQNAQAQGISVKEYKRIKCFATPPEKHNLSNANEEN